MDELRAFELTLSEKTRLWNAINEYATACGGNTGRKTMGAEREKAVVACEKAMEQIIYNRRAEPENKPLTLEQLRQMDGVWVWLIDIERPEYNGWYNIRPFHGGNHDIEFYGVDNNYYVCAVTSGRVKIYDYKPEQKVK